MKRRPSTLRLVLVSTLVFAFEPAAFAESVATSPSTSKPSVSDPEPAANPANAASLPEAPSPEETEYRATVTRAIEEFEQRNFDEASALFERAYALRPSARVLRGIAKVRFEQRQYVRALEALDAAFASTVDPLTEAMRAELGELRIRALAFVGTLAVVVTPASAVVTVDGRETKPEELREMRLDIGAHVLSASAPGHQATTRTFEITTGKRNELSLSLIEEKRDVVVVREERDRTGLWTVGALGVGLLGATIGSGIWMANRLDAADRCSAAQASGVTCATASAVNSERDLAVATLITSAVLTAGAGVTFVLLLGSDEGETKSHARLACSSGVREAFCSLGGTW